jgi:hypothetical protein
LAKIYISTAEKEVSFYPEGGHIVANIDNNVAFEIKQNTDQTSNSFSIIDENGNTLTVSKPTFNGMGSFTIKPNKSAELFALIDDKKIPLPKVLDQGFNLIVSNRSSEQIKIMAQTNIPNGLNGAFVICHQRGEEIAISQPMTGNAMAFRVNKSELKDGVAQITLFDKSGIPLAERSVFIYHPEKQPIFSINQKYEYFNTRSLVDLEATLANLDGSPLEGDYCVSVVDSKEVNHHEDNLDIKSYFLLTSDVTREIAQPSFYFKDFDAKKNALLDLTMLVHGWTRIKSEDLMKEDEINLDHAPERGVTISGRVVDKSGKGLSQSKVDLSILNVQGSYVDQAECGRNGRFIFYDVPLLKDQLVFLKAYEEILDKKKKSKSINEKVIIQLDDPKAIQVTSDNYSKVIWQKEFQPDNFLNKALEKQRDDSSHAMIKITLDEVEINSFKTEQQAKRSRDLKLQKERGMIYAMYDSRIFMDSLRYVNVNWTVMDYVANLTPGARLVKRPPEPPLLTLRNKMRPPSYYLDGFPVDYNAIVNIDINTVEFIDVLRSSMTSVAFGDLAYGGVILVYTKPPQESKANDNDRKAKNVATYIGEGFVEAREFYSPDYSQISTTKPDNRTTLFWSPLINTDVNGKSSFKFYTCDKKSNYLVKIEGLSKDGKPFTAFHQFDVK